MPLTTGRLHTVKQALDLNIYETVDLKVKIMIIRKQTTYTPKRQNKVQNGFNSSR